LQRLTSYGVAWRSFTEQYLDSTGIFREAVISILPWSPSRKKSASASGYWQVWPRHATKASG
jgi:hypothetical protein